MLNIVNEELMSYSTFKTEEKGKSYTKIKVATSNKLQQYENDSRYNRNNVEAPTKLKAGPSNRIVSNGNALKPINREIIRISAPLKNIEDFENQSIETRTVDFELPMSINISANNRYQPRVEVRCHEQGDDRANLYVVAFPFNGMIKPIPENPQYRIYKGLIAASVKPFFFNNRKYRKVLYLIIEINKNLFNPDHKYHTDEISIPLESYALFDDEETGKKKTNHEVFALKILSANGDYISSWDYDVIDDAVMMAVEPGQQLWSTYDVTKNSSSSTQKKSYNKNKKEVSYEGNMMVTINRHGIRKEVPIKNNNRSKNKYKNDPYRYGNPEVLRASLDKMMQDSGMYDNEYENRSKKNGGKNRNGRDNRGKNRNRY